MSDSEGTDFPLAAAVGLAIVRLREHGAPVPVVTEVFREVIEAGPKAAFYVLVHYVISSMPDGYSPSDIVGSPLMFTESHGRFAPVDESAIDEDERAGLDFITAVIVGEFERALDIYVERFGTLERSSEQMGTFMRSVLFTNIHTLVNPQPQ